VADGLRALAAKYHLYLVSNCPDWYLEAFFRISGLRDLFSGSDCHGTSGLGKADMLTRLAARHGLRKALYVGDTQSDRDAAEGAGMHFAFVSYGFGSTVDPALAFAGFPELTAALLA
jgi:phosphoglycolate phosphatase